MADKREFEKEKEHDKNKILILHGYSCVSKF